LATAYLAIRRQERCRKRLGKSGINVRSITPVKISCLSCVEATANRLFAIILFVGLSFGGVERSRTGPLSMPGNLNAAVSQSGDGTAGVGGVILLDYVCGDPIDGGWTSQ
jgi:hypothetical protein